MKLQDANKLARELMDNYGLHYWSFTFNKRTGSYGLCSYKKRQIQLSEILTPICTDESIRNTLIHEIAHALTPGAKHGWRWKAQFIKMGGSGEATEAIATEVEDLSVYNSLMEVRQKYKLTCPTCKIERNTSRKPKKTRSCGYCNSYYDERHKLILTENF